MRLGPAGFARALQRGTSRIGMHFLPTFQEVIAISNTRNQLIVYPTSERLREGDVGPSGQPHENMEMQQNLRLLQSYRVRSIYHSL